MLQAPICSQLQSFDELDWRDVSGRISTDIRAALERVLETHDGGELSHEQSLCLAAAQGDDLLGLLVAANRIRRELVGDVVSYVVNRNINFTNICFIGCKFCAFSRGPKQPDAYFLSLEEVARKTVEASERGASEVCIQGGLPRDLPPYYYRDLLRTVKKAVPEIHTHAFSPMEIVFGVELTGMPLAEYLSMLKAEGLGTLPGTAAEILDDQVRAVLSRNKLSVREWREVVTTAHRCRIRTTCTMMY